MSIFRPFADLLSIDDTRLSSDLIFVLAGRPERKHFAWQLFQSGLAPRLIFSVGPYEIRQTAREPVGIPELLPLRDQTAPEKRHFWVDFRPQSRSISLADLKRTNTFWELHALGQYLAPDPPRTIAVISTSIHLQRVRLCCRQISSLGGSTLYFLPVPENMSSFRRDEWWKHANQSSYLVSEYMKLAAYAAIYGGRTI